MPVAVESKPSALEHVTMFNNRYGTLRSGTKGYRTIATDESARIAFSEDIEAVQSLGAYYLNIASSGDFDMINGLLEMGVDSMAQDYLGVSPLVKAVFLGYDESLRPLRNQFWRDYDELTDSEFYRLLRQYALCADNAQVKEVFEDLEHKNNSGRP